MLKDVSSDFRRYLYPKVSWESRMVGLTGARGVGKTTLLLQHIKHDLELKETLYVTAEDFYFANRRLLDLADAFSKQGGKHLFIDEVHKYKDWSKELKLIYDYHPELRVVFTGSSILDINKGVADLSRRAAMYHLHGLSFREYLQLFHGISARAFTLQEVVEHQVALAEPVHPLPLFEEYLRQGYYPFALENAYDIHLRQIINQTLETDIPQYAGMNVATGRKLKQLLAIVAQSAPFKPNFSSIAAMLGVSRNNVADYCLYIEEAGLIAQLRDATGGIRGLGKVNKVYLNNTNLMHSLAQEQPNVGSARETFFFNQTRVVADTIASPIADFQIGDMTFEVGGRSKKQKQVQGLAKGFVVKADIELGHRNIIPLWHFGMLY